MVTTQDRISIRERASADVVRAAAAGGMSPYVTRLTRAVNERKLAARRIYDLTRQATAALVSPETAPAQRGRLPDAATCRNSGEGLMTTRQVAELLQIDIRTVRLWNTVGVLKHDPRADGEGRFRREDVLTFSLSRPVKQDTGRRAGTGPA